MKGVVVEIDNAKCIVLFNNGKIGSLPKPPNCEVGMVITVNFNRKIIMLPLVGIIVLLTAGIMVWFVLRAQGMSPERFCNSPFLRKDIILPLSEYAGFDALFAHLGNPLREFSQAHSDHHSDRFYGNRKEGDENVFMIIKNMPVRGAGLKVLTTPITALFPITLKMRGTCWYQK